MRAILGSGWDLERVRSPFTTKLPLAALLGIEVIAADPSYAHVRLVGREGIARPGGMLAGPVLFATADMASYALTLVLRQVEDALTSNLLINFFRPALDLPLLGEAVSLRSARQLLTYDIRIWPEATSRGRLVAQATANWHTPTLAESSAAGRGRGHHACQTRGR
jgi:uncharacterized protein (TIGR00369 family)